MVLFFQDFSIHVTLTWHLHIIRPAVASYIWVDQSERLQVQANLEEHCDTRPRKKWPLLAIQRVDLADVVVHGADHEAADRGEGHRVGEVRPVLRRLRVALAAMDLMMMAIMTRMVMIAMKMVMVTMFLFSDVPLLQSLVKMRLLLVIVGIGR